MVTLKQAVSRFRSLSKLGAAIVLAGSLLSLALLAQEVMPAKHGDADLERGNGLYVLHCQMCHGTHGDDMNCIDIVPLAGLGRRPRAGLVGDVLSPSYFFRGTSFKGADARDLAAYLLSLKGEKGFDDPGLRCAVRLLDKRYELFDSYRAIDVRDGAAYAKGHIPNAERWPAGEESSERQPLTVDRIRQKLGLLAVKPGMTIVIYDDTVTPAAARLWWDLIRAGHKNVTILDGGLQEWVSEGYSVTTVVTPLVPRAYISTEAAEVPAAPVDQNYPLLQIKAGLPQPSSGIFDWEGTVTDGQLRTEAEIRGYLKRTEITFPGSYRVEGSDAEASFLVYVLRLLGYSGASYEPVSKLLIAHNPDHRGVESPKP